MFTTQKRRKTNRKNVYGHRTREFVHGYIDEKQQTLALEVLNSFTQPHYVPPPQDLQFVLYLITSPSEFPSVPPSLPFHALDRLLHTHNPLDIAPSIPSCSSAILPTNTHTTAKKTAEFRDALPAYLGWDYDRGGMDKAIWKRMRRCRDEGLWELMYEEPEKGKGRGEQTSPLTTPSSLRDGEDDEESPTAQRRLSMPGWRLLQWFVAVCEKDTALHAPRGVPYSPVFLRQIKKPYDSTGQMQRSEAEPIMGILREAFEIDDEETETDFESTPEEEEEDDDGVEKSEKELEKIEVERAKRAERARQRRERYREMILSGLQKQELAIRLLSLLVTTATNPSAIPTPETTHPSRDSSPTPSDSAERSAPLTPPTSSPSRTPSLTPAPAPAPPSSSSKAPFHTDTLSSHLIHLSSSLSSPRAREKMLQGWQGAEGVEWGPKSHLCALWVEHWAGVGKVKADERRRGRGRRGGKKAEKALEWKKGWCGMSAPTVEYLLELLGMSASGKDLATQQILLQSKLALVSVLNENKDVYLENEDRVEISRQWQKVKGKVGKSLEIGGKGIDATAVKSLHRVGQFVVHAVDNLFM